MMLLAQMPLKFQRVMLAIKNIQNKKQSKQKSKAVPLNTMVALGWRGEGSQPHPGKDSCHEI
jgi:hypothetical protein